jgi:hypothetical protein
VTEQGRLTPEGWPSHVDVQDSGTQDAENTKLPVVPFATQGYRVGFHGSWLTKDGERLIWLPPDYRSSYDFQKHLLVTDSVAVIRNSFDQLLVFGFDD